MIIRRSIAICFLLAVTVRAQIVTVTLNLETNKVSVGETTTLHVYAQIIPEKRGSTDRIFSWYLNFLNSSGSAVRPDFQRLIRTASDQVPSTSSSGLTVGSDRTGIYDTFLNLPAAGRDTRVELFSVPLEGIAPGRTTLRVAAGSGVPALTHDFIVAPSGGGDPLFGGIYSTATIELEVVSGGNRLAISGTPLPGGGTRLNLSFPLTAGQNHFVEFKNELRTTSAWQTLPGAPHNAGTVTDTNSFKQRFYRLRVGQ